MHGLLVLEDAVLARLARSPQALSEFPFLGTLAVAQQAVAPTKRGCCGKKNRTTTVSSYAAVRAAIGALPVERKSRLKQLLSAKKVRVRFTNTANQAVALTF